MTLEAGQTFKLWLVWGIWATDVDIRQGPAKGMRNVADGVDWYIPVPKALQASAKALAVSTISAVTLAALTFY